MGMEELPPEELEARLEEIQVVDIRPAEEYDSGHVPGALNLPIEEFADRVDEIECEEAVALICHVGQASVQAARFLESYRGAGEATVASVAGGYRAWDGPLESTGAESVADPDAPF